MWLLEFKFIWLWILIVNAVLFALFLIITLALAESGAKTKAKWLKLTVFSFLLMTALIIFKPRENMEQVQYVPAPLPAQENVEAPKDTAANKSTAKTAAAAGSKTGGDKSPGVSGKAQDTTAKTTAEQSKDAKSSMEYKDPVLEEILKLKRQAEESGKEDDNDNNSDSSNNNNNDNNSNGDNNGTSQASILVTPLNVRDKGSMDGGIITTLNTGDIVEVINQAETGEWAKIRLNNGQTGWVVKKYLRYS